MSIRSILLKTTSLIACTLILSTVFIPVLVSASSLTDSAKKVILETVEDIEIHIEEERYPGYKEKLKTLKRTNPNWKFTLYYTGLDWNNVIYNETKGLHSRSLVQGKTGEWLCNVCGTKVYDSGAWMCASEKAVAYLMDVRNYLVPKYIFQFEELSYNPETYTIEGIEKVLNGTFMYQKSIREYYNNNEFEDITFAKAIMNAANSSGVSPYYLAARIRQEIGVNGSDSIYGTYKGFEGLYNFYNIGANSGEDPIANGLKYASNTTMGKYLLPWNDPVKAIKGGAIWIATNYIAVGQDTLYFQKFDVVNNGTALFNHQYMQNIFAARSEGYTTYNTYSKLGLLDNNYNFIIPVYDNMPTNLSPEPGNLNTENNTNKEEEKEDTNIGNNQTTIILEQVKINASNVRLRKTPTTSSAIVATLAKNTEATRLEKKVAYKDGYYWDKIKLSNGTIGYVATNYLSIITGNNTNTNTNTNSSTTKTEKMKVNANNVRVRKSATTSSAIVATLAKNTEVTRLEKKVAYKNGYYWDKIKLSNGTIGYIATNYLSGTTISNTSSSTITKTGVVNASNVRLRSGASTSSRIVKTLSKGTKVTILQKKAAYKNGHYWDKVKLSNGTTGYIASKYLS